MRIPSPLAPCVSAVIVLAGVLLLGGCYEPCTLCDPALGDASAKLRDLTRYLAIERSDAASSGNLIFGHGAAAGGRGQGTVALRISRTPTDAPLLGGVVLRTDGTAAPSSIPVRGSSATTIAVDGSLNIWSGFPSGPARVFGIDVVASAASLPVISGGDLSTTEGRQLTWGLGAKLSLLDGNPKLPAVSLSFWQRALPSVAFHSPELAGGPGETVRLNIDQLSVGVTSWRLAAAHRLGKVGVTAGVGNDRLSLDGTSISAELIRPGQTVRGNQELRQYETISRGNLFFGASYALSGISVIGEFSRHGGSTIGASSGNEVGGPIGRARSSLTIGARLDY